MLSTVAGPGCVTHSSEFAYYLLQAGTLWFIARMASFYVDFEVYVLDWQMIYVQISTFLLINLKRAVIDLLYV